MAAKRENVTYFSLRAEVLKGEFRPIYVLQGEEPYYIDQLSDLIVEKALDDSERDFNLNIYYGNEADVREVIATCLQYPAFAQRRVVVLREAQLVPKQLGSHKKDLELFKNYAEKPLGTTVLVICHKGGAMAAKPFTDQLKASKSGVVLDSAKVRKGRDLQAVINNYATMVGCNIDAKSTSMLADSIGNDLSRLFGELDKLRIIVGDTMKITPDIIEKNIGISKDFNNFELIDALVAKNPLKVYRIIEYFEKNPKNNPVNVTISQLFSFYSSLLLYVTAKNRDQRSLMDAVGAREAWQMRKYEDASRNYSKRACVNIITFIRECDTKTKGIGSRQEQYALLSELIYKILHA